MASKRPGPLQPISKPSLSKEGLIVSMASKRPGPLQQPAHIVLLYKHKIDLFA